MEAVGVTPAASAVTVPIEKDADEPLVPTGKLTIPVAGSILMASCQVEPSDETLI